ncbi:30S ribosomal protein S8 [Deferribacterales bacterium RsTz2092]|nr:30S ribosomal protein S8 [Deferribacterales bacterium]
MNSTDNIADMLTRIRNALMVKHTDVSIPYSAMKEKLAKILNDEGYVRSFRVANEGVHKEIVVVLKYTEAGDSVIRGLKRISKPGRRVYVNNKNLSTVLGGLGKTSCHTYYHIID